MNLFFKYECDEWRISQLFTLHDNLDIVKKRDVIASIMVGGVITINLDLRKVIIICFTGL